MSASEKLVEFAHEYGRQIDEQPHRATTATAAALGISRATAIRRLAAAREAGLIDVSDHYPQHARWTRGGESWLACVECREPWPCIYERGRTFDVKAALAELAV